MCIYVVIYNYSSVIVYVYQNIHDELGLISWPYRMETLVLEWVLTNMVIRKL